MIFGKTIYDLRKKKNVTQEEMAAELGVTAAAVSKWENGYTLPDILMLCALADYFEVTTDELLGRNPNVKYAVIAVSSPELGESIRSLAKAHGFVTKQIFSTYADALKAVNADNTITHLLVSFDKPMNEDEKGEGPKGLRYIEVHAETPQQVLDGFELYFQNIEAYDTIALKSKK